MSQSAMLGGALELWLLAVAVLIVYRVVTERASLRGLIRTGEARSGSQGGSFAPERLQLLVLTVGGLIAYAVTAFSERRMPPVDEGVLVNCCRDSPRLGSWLEKMRPVPHNPYVREKWLRPPLNLTRLGDARLD